ncbi:MAG TPA: GAF domain-containing protein [Verrucomicrobiae bacterium]|nr:GAF domain-containing protein [Verrucomicrobiae bacterium]
MKLRRPPKPKQPFPGITAALSRNIGRRTPRGASSAQPLLKATNGVEARIEAFSQLGHRLAVAKTARAAAQIIVDVADKLLGWDSCSFSLYSAQQDVLRSVLSADVVNGRRAENLAEFPAFHQKPPSPLVRRVLQQGGQLLLRTQAGRLLPDAVPFGDVTRPSASLLFVPVKSGASVIGILSIQSYTSAAYDQHSLETLQALADHCGGALDRIQAQESLLHRAERDKLVSTLSASFINLPPRQTDTAIGRALEIIGTFTGADHSCLYCLTPDSRTAQNTHQWSAKGVATHIARLNVFASQPFSWFKDKFTSSELVNLPDMQDLPPEAQAERELFHALQIKSLLAAPLVYGDSLIGVLTLDTTREERLWSEDDVGLLAMTGQVLANALQHKRASERILRLNRLYSVLSKINELIVRSPSPEVLYQQACRIAVKAGLFRLAWVGAPDLATGMVKPLAHFGFHPGYLRNLRVSTAADQPEGLGPAGTAIREGKYQVCNDVQADPRVAPWRSAMAEYGYRSVAAFPLRFKSGPNGVLALYSAEAHCFDSEDIKLLEQLANDLAFATEFFAQREELQLQGAALESAANGILITNPQGTVLWHNTALTRLTGYNSQDLVGKNVSVLKSGEHGPEFYRVLWGTISSGKVWRGEIINKRKDGSLYSEEMTITPVRNESGIITHYIAIKQDIGQRKELEEQLRQAQKMDAIGKLAGGIAHDFNNLLAVIRGNAELILMEPAHLNSENVECLGQLTTAAERAANLTRQLLTFSRKQVMQPQVLDLNDVVGNLTKMLKRIIGEDIQLQCTYAARLPAIRADAGMIEQVLVNLVVNARDAMPKGGQLVIATESAAFTEDSLSSHAEARPGQFAVLTVRDSGTGIAPEHLPRIFEPFFTTKVAGKGTGLGLATVYGIVAQHQGWLDVNTQPGVGSTFRVFLPGVDAPVTQPQEEPTQTKPPGGTETILLVEDDDSVRALTLRILEKHGYRVLEAPSGAEALRLWLSRAKELDLLLTDVVMPGGVTGRELAERLLLEKPGLKVAFMSGYSGDLLGTNTEFVRRINARFLAKPCNPSRLLDTIRSCLDGAFHPS